MWKEIADGKDEFIGGWLQDTDTSFFPLEDPIRITDILFDGERFCVEGTDYGCGVNIQYGSVYAESGWLHVSTPYSSFRFKGIETAGV